MCSEYFPKDIFVPFCSHPKGTSNALSIEECPCLFIKNGLHPALVSLHMQEHKRSIFRNESLQHHLARQEASIFPRLVQPRSITILWLILVLTVVSSLLILLKGVPIYSPGVTVVGKGSNNSDKDYTLTTIFSGADTANLHPGTILIIETNKKPSFVTASIIEVEPTQISLSVARARFGLTEKDCSSIQFPASVALAHPTGADLEVFQTGDRNSAYLSFIPRGSQRAISYLFTINDGVKNQLR